jgi:3'-phosphoadenosine 5'-phosphosulfate (PAPS) 3'-phosphatase
MSIDAGFLESLNQPLKKIVQDAANAIMDVYRKDDFESEIKSDGSPVTEADNNANKIIVSCAQRNYSKHSDSFRRNL